MKRYIKLVLVGIITLSLIFLLFILLIKQDNSYIIYIKFQVNPSFVMGINREEKVIFYNALNEDGNRYNLSMFSGKTLNEAMQIFMEKLQVINPDEREIVLSIMTKNHVLENSLYHTIMNAINSYSKDYQVILSEPTFDELEKYSSEVVYNLKRTLNNDQLKEISQEIYNNLDNYIIDKINKLHLTKEKVNKQKAILEEKIHAGYFNDFVIANITLKEEKIRLSSRSTYDLDFTFNEDGTYAYFITLKLEMDYEKKETKTIVETYKFDYEQKDDVEYLRNLKNYYYTFGE